MYPAQTAKSIISLNRIKTCLSVDCFPAFSIGLTVLITSGAVISSSCQEPRG